MIKKTAILALFIFALNLSAQTKSSSLRKAKRYATNNDYEAAAKQYQQALKLDSNNYNANVEYGLLQTDYLNNHEESGKYLLRAEKLSKKDTASEIIYGLAQYYQFEYDYDKAIAYYNRTLKYIEKNEDGDVLRSEINRDIANCKFAKNNPETVNRKRIKIVNLGDSINTVYPEYVPIVNKDETIIMFTSRRKKNKKSVVDDKDGEYYEDMYIARKDKKDGKFKNAHPFSPADADVKEISNTRDHESVISISYSGDRFYTYRKNKIYESDLKNNTWSSPKEMDANIDADIYQNHLCISKDGQTIFFSSERAGGLGGLDLYVTQMQADGKWSPAVTLGNVINTKDDDGSPQISEDGKTLYFSSKGHPGFGGYDIFKTTRKDSAWFTPVNLGLPFNSPGDDIYMTINGNETHGYFSSSRVGGYGDMDIYEITYGRKPFESFKTDSLERVSFTSPDTVYANQPVTFTAIGTSRMPLSSFNTHYWAVNDSILNDTSVKAVYTFTKPGTYLVKMEAETPDKMTYGKQKQILVLPAKQVTDVAVTNSVPRKNIDGLEPVYFGFNKYRIDEAAKQAIERNITILDNNSDIIIEVSAYADSRGPATYNQALSEKRAKSIVKYLKKKGFNTKRLKQVDWFGEKNPVNNCTDAVPCTENEYKLNRRAEFRLVK
jgi:outer membrane protein OmpA-like peptidoglycan-associated protein/tetratricopeptide (TPR) repeat protein